MHPYSTSLNRFARTVLFTLIVLFSVVTVYLVQSALFNKGAVNIDQYESMDLVKIFYLMTALMIFVGLLKGLTKLVSVHIVGTSNRLVSISKFLLRILSAMPTPVIAAPLFLGYFSLFDKAPYLIVCLILFISAIPTALQIGVDAFSGYSPDVLSSGTALGMDKTFCLAKLCAPSFDRAFTTSSLVGSLRVFFENWAISLQFAVGMSPVAIAVDPTTMATLFEQTYQHISSNISWFTIVLLVLLSLIGRVWLSVVSFLNRGG